MQGHVIIKKKKKKKKNSGWVLFLDTGFYFLCFFRFSIGFFLLTGDSIISLKVLTSSFFLDLSLWTCRDKV